MVEFKLTETALSELNEFNKKLFKFQIGEKIYEVEELFPIFISSFLQVYFENNELYKLQLNEFNEQQLCKAFEIIYSLFKGKPNKQNIDKNEEIELFGKKVPIESLCKTNNISAHELLVNLKVNKKYYITKI